MKEDHENTRKYFSEKTKRNQSKNFPLENTCQPSS
jgi:hypothetical protein